jgi:phosphoglycerate dehydrogenase-like enzyme
VRVVFTDPAWALDASGTPDPGRALLERQILEPEVRVEFGYFDGEAWALSGPRLLEQITDADALVVYRCQVDEQLLDAAGPNLRVIARSGVGVDNLNIDLLARRGIHGFNISDYCGDEVSTHTLALLLALERQVCAQDRLVRAGRWGIHKGGIPRRISSRDVGIVGFGRIGRATARRLHAFYGRVFAYDPYVAADLMASHGVTAVPDLGELFSTCDAVVVHSALNQTTDGLVGSAALAHAGRGCLLVNTARGRLVDLEAVLEALQDGRLGGFASDVFSPEDPNASPLGRSLLAREDTVVSSHRAFLSEESEHSLRIRVSDGIRSVLCEGSAPADGFLV